MVQFQSTKVRLGKIPVQLDFYLFFAILRCTQYYEANCELDAIVCLGVEDERTIRAPGKITRSIWTVTAFSFFSY